MEDKMKRGKEERRLYALVHSQKATAARVETNQIQELRASSGSHECQEPKLMGQTQLLSHRPITRELDGK